MTATPFPDVLARCESALLARLRALLTGLALVALLAIPAAARGDEPVETTAEASSFRPEVREIEASQNLAHTPEDISDLLDLERRIRGVIERGIPATVGLRIGGAQGSGVIISPDGYVLTAGHVSGAAGRPCVIILHDGRRLDGVTLGRDRSVDAGLVKITDDDAGPLAWVEVGQSGGLPLGTWTVATGHPGGYRSERPPVVRVGRISANNDDFMRTDNTLVGGDSGGPLFDLDGRVIGIHSRISMGITVNVHVPVDRFVNDWDRLAAGEEWGGMRMPRAELRADDGLRFDLSGLEDAGARVAMVVPGSPAAQAGIERGDVILQINNRRISTGQDMVVRRMEFRPGREVTYRIDRDGEELRLSVTPLAPGEMEYPEARRPGATVMGVHIDQSFTGQGIRLGAVVPNGPGEEAGLRAGDVIVMFNGRPISQSAELQMVQTMLQPGDEVSVRVMRYGNEHDLVVVLASRDQVFPQRGR